MQPTAEPSSRPRSWARIAVHSAGTAFVFSVLFSALAGISGIPGRLEEISNFAKDGYKTHEYLLSAFFRDVNVNLLFFLILWLAIWTLLKVRAGLFKREVSLATLLLLVTGFATLVGVGQFMGAEFRVERGIYPTWFDLRNSEGGSAVGLAYARLAFGSAVLPGWAALIATALIAAGWLHRNQRALRSGGVLFLSILLLVGASASSRNRWQRLSGKLPSIMSHSTTESPYNAFIRIGRLKKSRSNGFLGVVRMLRSIEHPETEHVRTGLRQLGLNPKAADRLNRCETDAHPLRESLDRSVKLRSASSKELLSALKELSSALFDRSTAPVRLHQILVETFLSADFASLGSPLPREAIPFWNDLIEQSRHDSSTTAVANDMRQAGVRTSQALSASFCGLGTLPHLLSMGRDLQPIPLRCLPEILKDAGFITEMHHGYRPEFDARTQFFDARGMDFWHIRRIPGSQEGLTSFWDGDIGLSDLKLVEFSLKRAAQVSAQASTYTGLLTLSSHRPFTPPRDFDPNDAAAAEAVIRKLPAEIAQRPLAQDRVRILRYVDSALKKYMRGIAALPSTSRSITLAVGYGDHSHSEADVFGSNTSRDPADELATLSRIPFFIHVFPESVKNHPDRPRILAAIRRLNQAMQDEPISQNDVPRMILALLSHSRELRQLPESQRWHTLGGQTLSPFAKPPQHLGKGVVWGVDGRSEAFVIDRSGRPLATETQFPLDGPEATRRGGVYQPINEALSALIKHSLETCDLPPHYGKISRQAANHR